MTGVGDDSRGRLVGRPWLVVGFTLAIGATLALVLSNDLRWLRLGIIAALWAAVIGGFLAVKYRKDAAHSEDVVAEAQAVYELELEREIAARREYELEIESETRQRADEDSREELDALRAEVIALRDSLQSLFGGEVLLERVALTAQATRMRSVGDDHRLVGSAEAKSKQAPAQLPAGKKRPGDPPEPRTELMDRVLAPSAEDKRRKVQANQTAGQTTQYSPITPAVRVKKPEDNGRRPQGDVAGVARPIKPAVDNSRAEATRRQQAPVEQRVQRPPSPTAKPAERPPAERRQPSPASPPKAAPVAPAQVKQPVAAKAAPVSSTRKTEQVERQPERVADRPRPEPEFTRSALDQVESGHSASSYVPTSSKPVEHEPFRVAEPEWRPAWSNGNGHGDRPASDPSAAFPSRRDLSPVPAPVAETSNSRHGAHRSGDEQYVPDVSRSAPDIVAPKPVVANDTPLNSGSVSSQSRPGGRRRRAEDEDAPVVESPAPASGGRRRRPDGEPPAWQPESPYENGSRHAGNGATNGSSRSTNGSAGHAPSGSHSLPDTGDSAPRNGTNGHRSAEPEPAEAGSHAAGRSVTELLAAHGASDSTPRRRRRAED
jgi:hypothetical protein